MPTKNPLQLKLHQSNLPFQTFNQFFQIFFFFHKLLHLSFQIFDCNVCFSQLVVGTAGCRQRTKVTHCLRIEIRIPRIFYLTGK